MIRIIQWLVYGIIGYAVVCGLVWLVLPLVFALKTTNWTGEHEEAGPVPLMGPGTRIIRLVNRREALGEDTFRLRWDEGQGPVAASDRVKSLLDAIPKELHDRLLSTRKAPAKLYAPFRDQLGGIDEPIYDSWGIVVSLNPDVLILSAYERPVGPHDRLPLEWGPFSKDKARRDFVN